MSLLDLPRRGYVKTQTRLEFLPRLTQALGGKVRIWVKHDDELPGAAGGNKTRKLDFLVADALAKGADTLVTCGSIQSNHARLTLSWAKKEGLDAHLVLEAPEGGHYDACASGNNLLYKILGVDGVTLAKPDQPIHEALQEAGDALQAAGRKPYLIVEGGSNALGSVGYVGCALEIFNQSYALGIRPKAVFTPSGSAGTQAGLILGFSMLANPIEVWGVNVSRTNEGQVPKVAALVSKTAELLRLPDPGVGAVKNLDGYFAPGYALVNDAMKEAVFLFAQTESILLDPVYSGKAAAGLIDQVRKGVFPEGSDVVFLHTGGTPALYEYKDFFFKS